MRIGAERGGVVDVVGVSVGIEEEREVREETNCDGVRVERPGALGGVLGEGVRETDGTVFRLRRGLPERDWARERMSCWAAV